MAELFVVTGIEPVRQRLQELSAQTPFLMVLAVQQEGEAILAASQPLVPVDTGALRASGTVSDAALDGAVATVAISYGGPGTGFARTPSQYAIMVHEDTTMAHPHGGQAHFLSQPFFEATQGMLERLADALRVAA
jgi:hypothetical protein